MTMKSGLTIDDIARELGVSKTTVSRAISGKGRISAATRERVRAYIETHHYKPNASARSLAERRTWNLALVLPRALPDPNAPALQKVLCAVTDEAFSQGYHVILCLSADGDCDQLARTLDYRKADGVILACDDRKSSITQMLISRGIPFVTLDLLNSDPRALSRAACRELIHALT